MSVLITILPIFMALLGIAVRVGVPFFTKKANDKNLAWDWNEALPPILGGLSAFAALLASGVLTSGVTWFAALGYGLAATASTAGAGDIIKMGQRILAVIKGGE